MRQSMASPDLSRCFYKRRGFSGTGLRVPDERAGGGTDGSQTDALFRAMADSAPAPIWVTGKDGIEFANRALIDFSGRPAERLLGTGWTEIVHPDDLPEIVARRASAWEGNRDYAFEARMRRADGEWRWLSASLRPCADGEWRWLSASLRPRLDPNGNIAGFVGMAFDVTAAKSA